MKLQDFLTAKPIFYKKIDFDRMPNTYANIKHKLQLPPIIHVVGTNGKGSTGRWLSLMLQQANFQVGHYTSPHILSFNERFWLDGEIVSDETLENAHTKLFSLLGADVSAKLSYFEYATFLAAVLFEKCDFVIMEAGVGGEHDGTNVFPKRLSIITPIGYDHKNFLGESIEEIATTKLNSLTTTTIIAPQDNPKVITIAKDIANKKDIKLQEVDILQMSKELKEYAKKYHYPSFLHVNILTALYAALELQVAPNFAKLKPLDLRGRFEKIAPNITIDVGHNPLSAKEVAKNFQSKSVVLIYNSFEDKDVRSILKLLEPITLHVKILPIYDEARKSAQESIQKISDELKLSWSFFDGILKADETYLVFGSFYLVEAFLKRMNEK